MPWTLSHPAAVLPLRRLSPRLLDFPALVLGSMTPDIGYSISRFDLATFAHTLPGSFLACIPTGLILLFIFYLFCKPISYALPSPHRQALLPCCPTFPRQPLRWGIILLSLLLGAWTHIFWDAFTHEHGWFVVRIPWLQQVAGHIGSTTIYMFLVMQELSTVVGLVILLLSYRSWLRHRPPAAARHSISDTWRYWFWTTIALVSLLVTLPTAMHYAASVPLHGFPFYRSVVFRVAIYGPLIALPFTIVGSIYLYSRREI